MYICVSLHICVCVSLSFSVSVCVRARTHAQDTGNETDRNKEQIHSLVKQGIMIVIVFKALTDYLHYLHTLQYDLEQKQTPYQFPLKVASQHWKVHTHPSPPFSSLPKAAVETLPIPVWLNTDPSEPWSVECRLFPFSTKPPRWPSGKVSASRAEDPGFESRLRRDFSGIESYQ